MALKHVKHKVDRFWTNTKRLIAILSVWGLIFSLATISHLGVGFEYDGALVDSTAALAKAAAQSPQIGTETYWSVANQSYDRDSPKIIPYSLAWIFKIFGFRVSVFALRPPVDGEALQKDWRHLVPESRFHFVPAPDALGRDLVGGRYILFFGSSDQAIQEAKSARVFPIRVLRKFGSWGADYHPGFFREWSIPYSQY